MIYHGLQFGWGMASEEIERTFSLSKMDHRSAAWLGEFSFLREDEEDRKDLMESFCINTAEDRKEEDQR
jgi:hypothetical protein